MNADTAPMDEKDLICTDAGDVIVMGATNPFTGIVDEFCLPLHPDFESWSNNFKCKGYEIVELTLDEVLDAASLPAEKMQ